MRQWVKFKKVLTWADLDEGEVPDPRMKIVLTDEPNARGSSLSISARRAPTKPFDPVINTRYYIKIWINSQDWTKNASVWILAPAATDFLSGICQSGGCVSRTRRHKNRAEFLKIFRGKKQEEGGGHGQTTESYLSKIVRTRDEVESEAAVGECPEERSISLFIIRSRGKWTQKTINEPLTIEEDFEALLHGAVRWKFKMTTWRLSEVQSYWFLPSGCLFIPICLTFLRIVLYRVNFMSGLGHGAPTMGYFGAWYDFPLNPLSNRKFSPFPALIIASYLQLLLLFLIWKF